MSGDRQDLGAQFARITQRLIDAERPLLRARGLSMWQYIALSALADGEAPTQLALAQQIGHDKTRLIALLDELQTAGLITREPDPADRRARIISLTARGRRTHVAAQRDIHAMEDELLSDVSAADRDALRRVLAKLG